MQGGQAIGREDLSSPQLNEITDLDNIEDFESISTIHSDLISERGICPGGLKSSGRPPFELARWESAVRACFKRMDEVETVLSNFKSTLSYPSVQTSPACVALTTLAGTHRGIFMSTLKEIEMLGEEADRNGCSFHAETAYLRVLKASDLFGDPDEEFTWSILSKMASFYKRLGEQTQVKHCLERLSKLEPRPHAADLHDIHEGLATSFEETSKAASTHLPRLDLGPWSDARTPLNMKTPFPPLQLAIASRNSTVTSTRSIQKSTALGVPNREPVHANAKENITDFWDCYIRSPSQVHIRDIFFRSPLFVAAQFGDLEATVALLRKGADTNDRDANSHSTLEAAARSGSNSVVEKLLDADANADAKALMFGSTPLQAAAEEGHIEVVKTLLGCVKHSQSVTAERYYDNKTASQLARKNGYIEISELLDRKAEELVFMSQFDEDIGRWNDYVL
ncbi:hypothetical protein GP486_003512 [Trichoglossum hirsutum]|uniref:Ankyrin repeat protein n=1 Tax=Trichoglossum hirsutum TaxID=265104 RepID=A0A9P8LD31_9PEZI|nr:hypothetical protein GP486_003512 [Trichoglossum hirsutum]